MTITLNALPEALHQRLNEAAQKHGRSLSAEITAILQQSCMAHPVGSQEMLDEIRHTRSALGQQFSAEEIATYRKQDRV